MEPLQAIVLGIVQGLTEFLPISSSGHLVLFQQLFGLKEAELLFDISVHMGTLTAVIIFFWRDICDILIAPFKREENVPLMKKNEVRLALLIIAGSVPTAAIGLLFNEIADRLFSSTILVGGALLINGIILWLTQKAKAEGRDIEGFSYANALIIGAFQGLAIIPGISRSGLTISIALFLGLKREIAARYSFLLSIPAIVGAQLISLKNMGGLHIDENIIMGTVTAAVVGYGALVLLVYIVQKGRMHYFAPYCWLVGIITLASDWIGLVLGW